MVMTLPRTVHRVVHRIVINGRRVRAVSAGPTAESAIAADGGSFSSAMIAVAASAATDG